MRLNGSFKVSAPRQQVYAFLTDPEQLVQSLPEVRSSQIESPEAFSVVTRVGVGPVRGLVDVRMRIVEKHVDERAVFKGQGNGIGSSLDMEAAFALRDADEQATEVDWYGDAKIVGRLASVAGGMLEPLAKKNMTAFVDAVRRGLEGGNRP